MPKKKDYKVSFAIGFVIQAEDEDQAEEIATEKLYNAVSEDGIKNFNTDIDEI